VGLFTDTDYQDLLFEYGDFKQTLKALKTSSTDYDLTGQIIWKAADILSKYTLDVLGPSELKGKRVLELGSGPGKPLYLTCLYFRTVWIDSLTLRFYSRLVRLPRPCDGPDKTEFGAKSALKPTLRKVSC